jgi:hypothetical protein
MMPAHAPLPEIFLSPAYRHVQRLLAAWLDTGQGSVFALRAALGALDRVEYDRLSRWLAWSCVAAASHGDARLETRLERLDPRLARTLHAAMDKLPGAPGQGRRLRLSA